MLEEQGRVVAVSSDEAWVQTIRESACHSCAARKGCGQRALNQRYGEAFQIRVANVIGAQVGDEVVVGVPESSLLKASLMLYLAPLLMMVVGAIFMERWVSAQEGWVILGGLVGLAAGFVWARWFSQRYRSDQSFAPQLLRHSQSQAPACLPLDEVEAACNSKGL